MNHFIIQAQLPSLNDYQSACRSSWQTGAKFKREQEVLICNYIRVALLKKTLQRVNDPCEIYIEWHEATKRRDVDNIQSAQKFILDALQSEGVIANDSRRYVKQIHHTVVDDTSDFVTVCIKEVEK